MPDPSPTVAYLVKGWPRLSEIFIASEIERLERLGVPIELHALKPSGEDLRHPVVDRIRAETQYMPATSSLSATTFPRWLRQNLRPFLPSIGRVARRRPLGLARAVSAAAMQAVRARRGWRPRSVYARELLESIVLSERLLATGRVGHIHAHFAHGATTVAWLCHLTTRVPFSFTGHARDIYSEDLNPAGLLRRKMRAASFVVTCTGANRDHLTTVSPETRVHLVYHGMNADFQRLARDAAPTRNGHVRILGVGRLVPKKGFDTFVDALGHLRDRGVDFEAAIAGESGAHEATVRERIAAQDLGDRVSLLGPMTQAELVEEYGRSTHFCLPCRVMDDGDRDGIPNVLVEAMASGLPVVTTPISGIPELVVDDWSGVLTPSDDPEGLADRLEALIGDPARGARLAVNARQVVAEHFDGDVLARRMASLFDGSAA